MFSEYNEKAEHILKQAEGIEAVIDNVEVAFSLRLDHLQNIREVSLESRFGVSGDVNFPFKEELSQWLKNIDSEVCLGISTRPRPGFTMPCITVIDKKSQTPVVIDLSRSDSKVYWVSFYRSNWKNYLDVILRLNEFAGNHPEWRDRVSFLGIDYHHQAPTDSNIYEELELNSFTWLWTGEGDSRDEILSRFGLFNITTPKNLCLLIYQGKLIWLGDGKEYTPEKELFDILEGREIVPVPNEEPEVESEVEISKEEITEKISLAKEYFANFKQGIEDQTNLSFYFFYKVIKNFRPNREPVITTKELDFSYTVNDRDEAAVNELCAALLEIFPQLTFSSRKVVDPTKCLECQVNPATENFSGGRYCSSCVSY